MGAPTSAATLFWNAQRKQVGVIGFWDVVAFDEVGEGVVVRDREMFQLMKQYMANGNFNRGTTVAANASLVFVGNIDDSVESLVNSCDHDLFKSLHPVFDLAILDRFSTFVPGWEIPKNRDENLTRRFDIYQRPEDWLNVGANDLDLRPCLETSVDVYPTKTGPKEAMES